MRPPLVDARSLLCRLRGRLCALPLSEVVETLRPLPWVALAGSPPFVLGVSVIRGVPTPVVDPGKLFQDAEETAPGRFVMVTTGARKVALAVDEVIGIRELPTAASTELPPLLREAAAEVVGAMGTLDAELLIVLRQARWIPESVWQAISAEGLT